MCASDSAHPWNGRHRRCNRASGQVDNAFAVGPGAGDPLRRTFADEQAIAWTTHIFLPGWSISNRLQNVQHVRINLMK